MQLSLAMPKPAVEVLHGVTIVDPYRWLEDRSSPFTRCWLEEQQELCEDYFPRLSEAEKLRSRVAQLLSAETIEQPAKIGDRYFYRRRLQSQEQACLCVQNTLTGEERVLVDPAQQGAYVAVAIHQISEDGRLLAYLLKHGGERTEEVHFVDADTGRILEDHLPVGYARGLAFTSDNTGVYYCHEPATITDEDKCHEVRLHRFGTSFDKDRVLFSLPRMHLSRMYLRADDTNLQVSYGYVTDTGRVADFYVAARSDHDHWKLILLDGAGAHAPFLHKGRLYGVSYAESPNGKIVEMRDDGTDGTVIVPEWSTPITGLQLADDHLYVVYEVDAKLVVREWSWSGEFLEQLPEPPDGSFGLAVTYTHSSDHLFFVHETFFMPPTILEYDKSTRSYRRWARQKTRVRESQFHVERVSYPSKDGTPIPMWLVSRDPPATKKTRPAILTGYGAAGVSMTPRFSALVTIMVELGCVFALPNIRGGSEFGKEWHEAVLRRNRQIVYDDFLAAADWLCAENITRPERLAIFGGSNSGLLVGAAMTQRPDLFRAVLCIAPILDMLRYEEFGDARKWREEHGSVEDPDEFRALYAYSPYHRVEEGVNYPATLFVSGDKDTQCDPAHVRKMAARLQNRASQTNSIVVDYSSERGHTASLPLSVRIDALARRIAFLCQELGIDVPGEDLQ